MVKKKGFYRIYFPANKKTLLTSLKFKTPKDAKYFISETGFMGKYKISREKRKIDRVI